MQTLITNLDGVATVDQPIANYLEELNENVAFLYTVSLCIIISQC